MAEAVLAAAHRARLLDRARGRSHAATPLDGRILGRLLVGRCIVRGSFTPQLSISMLTCKSPFSFIWRNAMRRKALLVLVDDSLVATDATEESDTSKVMMHAPAYSIK